MSSWPGSTIRSCYNLVHAKRTPPDADTEYGRVGSNAAQHERVGGSDSDNNAILNGRETRR
jgi:hypothetical protein